ncbi:MAG: amidohydrolase family protein [Acidobacteriia bacterium]|nr:amidohydrolase family protein [Terriglobia bacterium]
MTIVNVNATTERSALRPNMTILIRGDRIEDIRPTTEADLILLDSDQKTPKVGVRNDSRVIDGRGLFAIPGLIDTHVHLEWEGQEALMFRLFLANGVTAILEAGNPSPKVYVWRRQSQEPAFVGPRMEVCGPIMTGPPAAWNGMTVLTSVAQVRSAIAVRATGGARFAKIYAQLPPELSVDVINAAQRRGLRVMGHLGRTNALEATAFGINIITHLSGVPDSAVPDPEAVRAQHALGFSAGWQATNAAWKQATPAGLNQLIQHMVANRVALSPTLWYQKVFATLNEDTPEKREALQFGHVPSAISKDWNHFTMDVGDPKIYKEAWPFQKKFVKAFHDAGGMVIAGTDTANQYVSPGFGLHQEIETLHEAGLSNLEALKSATVFASRAMGTEQNYGSIEIGNHADVVLLGGNPLDDLKNARQIVTVIRSGLIYSPRQLLSTLPK